MVPMIESRKLINSTKSCIHLTLEVSRTDRSVLESLQEVLKTHAGPCAAYIHLRNPENAEALKLAIEQAEQSGAGLVVSCNTIRHPTNAIDVTPLIASACRDFLAHDLIPAA